jgi:hypothetical protein
LYDFTIYWPNRLGLFPDIYPVVSAFLCPSDYKYFPDINNIQRNFVEWSVDDLEQIRNGMQIMVDGLNYASVLNFSRGGVLFRYDRLANLRGFLCYNGVCPGQMNRFSFTGSDIRYAIGLSNFWSNDPDSDPQLWTVIHEFAHRANTVANDAAGGVPLQDELWNAFYFYGFPSNYAFTTPGDLPREEEYFAETFAPYVWVNAGRGEPEFVLGYRSLDSIFRPILDDGLIVGEETLREYFEEQIVEPFLLVP